MASVTFLGTGPGDVTPGRFQSSILLDSGGAQVLLDAGEPCSGQLLTLGMPLADLDAIWITHAHSDHVGGLPLLLQASWLHGRKRPLPVGVPAHLAEPLLAWLNAVFLPPATLRFPLEVFSWQTGRAVEFGGLSVTPHPTTHLDRIQETPGQLDIESFLFEIRQGSTRTIYTGDLGAASDMEALLKEPVELLICELAHLSIDDLINTLSAATVGTLCLTHVSGDLAEQLDEIKMRCERELPGVDAIYLPEDGERIEF